MLDAKVESFHIRFKYSHSLIDFQSIAMDFALAVNKTSLVYAHVCPSRAIQRLPQLNWANHGDLCPAFERKCLFPWLEGLIIYILCP